jgi:hypothetical protein
MQEELPGIAKNSLPRNSRYTRKIPLLLYKPTKNQIIGIVLGIISVILVNL